MLYREENTLKLQELKRSGIKFSDRIINKFICFAHMVDSAQILYHKIIRGEKLERFVVHIFAKDLEEAIECLYCWVAHEVEYSHAQTHAIMLVNPAREIIRKIRLLKD